MAFTFVVEDGTGLSNATSYVSVADADDILVVNIHNTATWDALSDTDKGYLLSWASRFLDAHTRWKGYKTVETSALRWPRTGVVDRDNILIDSDVIPYQLKNATANMARYLMTTDRTLERDQDGLVRVKADVVELEFRDGYTLPQIPTDMFYLIDGLGYISGGASRFATLRR